jgi:transposase
MYFWKRIIAVKMRYTLKDFKTEYPDDAACLRSVLENRYGDTCPRCGVIGVKWHPITGRKGFVCSECDRHVYPLADTIFRKSETSLWNWFYAIYQFSVAKNGVSAKELERTLGVTYKTAWRMAKQIRLLMQQDSDKLTGTVEVDETYIGGKGTRNWQNEKTGVYGVAERGGQAKAVVAHGGVNATTAIPFLKATVETGSKVMSDESRIYNRVKRDYIHDFVTHSKEEYVRGDVHTNSIEGLWGNWKKSMSGTYNRVSPKYLQSYLNEFIFRYNFRSVPICPVLLERAATLS